MNMYIKSINGSITNEQWIDVVESNPLIVPMHVFWNEAVNYAYAFVLAGKDKNVAFARLCQWGVEDEPIEVEIFKKQELEGYQKLQAIAKALDAELYYNKKEVFDPEKHLPKPKLKINRKKAWQEASFGENSRWLALTLKDASTFIGSLPMKDTKQAPWQEALKAAENSRICMITPAVEGYVFITGIDLPYFINILTSGLPEDRLGLDVLTEQLALLSKQYGEASYYEHYDRSMQLNGYFKASAGKFVYGRWYADGQFYEKGKVPRELKKLIDPESPMSPTAMEVSGLWAIDPGDLVYFEALKGAQVWVVRF